MTRKGVAITREEVLAQLHERDRRDRGRELAPLKPATDAIVIDASRMGVEEVVTLMTQRVSSAWRRGLGLETAEVWAVCIAVASNSGEGPTKWRKSCLTR